MNSSVFRVEEIMSILLSMNTHCLQSLLLRFALDMLNLIKLNLNHMIIDQRKLLCEIEANQSNCAPLKIN